MCVCRARAGEGGQSGDGGVAGAGAARATERRRAGQLFAQMRYQGPADAPWRLMGLDDFDLTGPIAIAADVSGSLDAPKIQGSLSSDALHLQSADTGTDISQISTRGGFAGSRLSFATLSGHTAGGGQVSGSGSIDFAGITDGHRPAIDLTLSVHKALLASRADMALTATGPMRVISDGLNGKGFHFSNPNASRSCGCGESFAV